MGKRICWLHVGAGKTGTSATQAWIFENHDVMRDAGLVTFPKVSGRNRNHTELIRALNTRPQDRPRKLNALVETFETAFHHALKNETDKDLFLSAEILSSIIFETGFKSIVNMFQHPDLDVRPILMTRNPVDMVNSAFVQRTKNFTTSDSFDAFAETFTATKQAMWFAQARRLEQLGLETCFGLYSPAYRATSVTERLFITAGLRDRFPDGTSFATPQKNSSLGRLGTWLAIYLRNKLDLAPVPNNRTPRARVVNQLLLSETPEVEQHKFNGFSREAGLAFMERHAANCRRFVQKHPELDGDELVKSYTLDLPQLPEVDLNDEDREIVEAMLDKLRAARETHAGYAVHFPDDPLAALSVD